MTVDLVARLTNSLQEQEISYCHWKSNTSLGAALAGDTDLDILVAEGDKERFESVLSNLGFVRAVSPHESWFPGIYHYYGYDSESEKIVHTHLHYKLILGCDLLKNYHLPLENVLLQNVTESMGVKTPLCELEFIVFTIRMVLKRRFLPLLLGNPRRWFKAVSGKGVGGLSRSAKTELDDLFGRAEREKVSKLLKEYFPFISNELFNFCLTSICTSPSKYSWLIAGCRLGRALKPFRRHCWPIAEMLAAKRVFCNCIKSFWGRMGFSVWRKKRLAGCGKIIAIVGGDGSGKSTNVEELSGWFGKWFDMRTMHMGKPGGFVLSLLRNYSRIRRKFIPNIGAEFCDTLIALAVSRSRYKDFQKAKGLRAKGVLVVLDRFPTPYIKYMDSPRIREMTGGKRFYSVLARREEKYYERIRGVDELIVLQLDPQIAKRRRPNDVEGNLAKRSSEIWTKQWPDGYAHIIDAGKPLEKVQHQVRDIAWEGITKKLKIVEIIGPAGSGKSALAEHLAKTTTNVQTHISVWEHKMQFCKTFFRILPRLIYLLPEKLPFRYMKVMVNAQVVLDLLQEHKKRPVLDCRCIVLHGGPIFLLAAFQIEWGSKIKNKRIKAWIKDMAKKGRNVFDMVIWLDADNRTLMSRINNRQQLHRMKRAPQETVEEFLDCYRSIFKAIVFAAGNGVLSVKYVDTGHLSLDEVTADIIKTVIS